MRTAWCETTISPVDSPLFRFQRRITYADCTLGNHVYYSRYLEFLEEARGEFFRSLGKPMLALQSEGVTFPVTECHLRYLTPARYDDVITIEIWPTLAQGPRLGLGYRLRNEAGSVLIEADTIHACVSLEEKPRRVPQALLAALQPFLRDWAR
jgi:acyl-CoA thioester hydrolase